MSARHLVSHRPAEIGRLDVAEALQGVLRARRGRRFAGEKRDDRRHPVRRRRRALGQQKRMCAMARQFYAFAVIKAAIAIDQAGGPDLKPEIEARWGRCPAGISIRRLRACGSIAWTNSAPLCGSKLRRAFSTTSSAPSRRISITPGCTRRPSRHWMDVRQLRNRAGVRTVAAACTAAGSPARNASGVPASAPSNIRRGLAIRISVATTPRAA